MKYLRQAGLLTYMILFLVFFTGIYFYFTKSQTLTIYGDDLTQYQLLAGNVTFSQIIDAAGSCFKFRPVWGIVSYLEIHLFKKTLADYFLFNVAIQAIITVLFTLIINLFLRSLLLSAFVGALMGLSRVAFYNITQLMCGGPMEGLAMIFFLAVLYNMVIYMTHSSDNRRHSPFYYLAWAVIFSNLAIYTHERYVVLFPAIIFIALFYPLKNKLPGWQKLAICAICVASVLANYAIKEYVYHYPFLIGTGTSSITHDFDLKKQLGYLGDALLSIIQVNSGPAYMIGFPFHEATTVHKVLAVLSVVSLCGLVFWYVFSNLKVRLKENPDFRNSLKVIFFLLVIFCANLAPAVSTLNMEQRWLQSLLALFILMVVIVFVNTRTSYPRLKYSLLLFFVLVFAVSDYHYKLGMDTRFWMKSSEWEASTYKDVTLNGLIRKETNTIYILVEKRNQMAEIGTNWVLRNGYIFDFYQGKSKTIMYLDTAKFSDPSQLVYLINFDRKTEQIVKLGTWVTIVTDEVLSEREKYFKEHGLTAKHE